MRELAFLLLAMAAIATAGGIVCWRVEAWANRTPNVTGPRVIGDAPTPNLGDTPGTWAAEDTWRPLPDADVTALAEAVGVLPDAASRTPMLGLTPDAMQRWRDQVAPGLPDDPDATVLDPSPTQREIAVGEVMGLCCDMHTHTCEPPSELCCRDCTEAAHDTFPIPHADGSTCVLEPSPAWRDAKPEETPGQLEPQLGAYEGAAEEWVTVGQHRVHRACRDARRDDRPVVDGCAEWLGMGRVAS